MSAFDEQTALMILSSLPQLGSIKIRLLIEYFGSASKALNADPDEYTQLPGFQKKTIEALRKWEELDHWKENLDLIEKYSATLIPYTHELYPKNLLNTHDFPVLLYMKGALLPKDQHSLAIIGTRQASIYGREITQKFSRDLAQMGFTIVSGLARGIDTEAHQAALQTGRTVAVIGSGLANIYPRENQLLAEKIAENGAILSEFPMNTPPDRQNFPQRNRIVSGMTLGALLIEAPKKSGAMLTMRIAEKQGRHLFTIPGRVDIENFEGNHFLLKDQQAQLVENATDIAQNFENLFNLQSLSSTQPKRNTPNLEPEEKNLIIKFPNEEITIQDLETKTNLPIRRLNILLMSLVLKRVVKEFPGKIYKKVSHF